jgi:hypothetical protein
VGRVPVLLQELLTLLQDALDARALLRAGALANQLEDLPEDLAPMVFEPLAQLCLACLAGELAERLFELALRVQHISELLQEQLCRVCDGHGTSPAVVRIACPFGPPHWLPETGVFGAAGWSCWHRPGG